jgi:hypothetical protein
MTKQSMTIRYPYDVWLWIQTESERREMTRTAFVLSALEKAMREGAKGDEK